MKFDVELFKNVFMYLEIILCSQPSFHANIINIKQKISEEHLDDRCGICYEDFKAQNQNDIIQLSCCHIFCCRCFIKGVEKYLDCCPFCRKILNKTEYKNILFQKTISKILSLYFNDLESGELGEIIKFLREQGFEYCQFW